MQHLAINVVDVWASGAEEPSRPVPVGQFVLQQVRASRAKLHLPFNSYVDHTDADDNRDCPTSKSVAMGEFKRSPSAILGLLCCKSSIRSQLLGQ